MSKTYAASVVSSKAFPATECHGRFATVAKGDIAYKNDEMYDLMSMLDTKQGKATPGPSSQCSPIPIVYAARLNFLTPT